MARSESGPEREVRRRHAASGDSITHTASHERWWTFDEAWSWFSRWELVRLGIRQKHREVLSDALWQEIDERFLRETRGALLAGTLIAYGAFRNGPIQALHPWEWTRLDLLETTDFDVSGFAIVQKQTRPRKNSVRKPVVSHAVLDSLQVLTLWPMSLASASEGARVKRAGRPASLRLKIQETLLSLSTRGYDRLRGPGKSRRIDVARRLMEEWRRQGDKYPYKASNVSQTLKLVWNGRRSFRAVKAESSRRKRRPN